MTETERPNTVSGLIAKHKELSDLRERYRYEIKKLTTDLDHIEACIKLFSPRADAQLKELVKKRRAKRGSVKRFVLNTLREASEPMTSRDLSELWAQDQGLPADEGTLEGIRKKLSVTLTGCVRQGIVECDGQVRGKFGPYKLWKIKRGG